MLRNFFTFSRLTLFVALCISAIAAWYSVIGLTAIFAGAVLPIIIMGSVLEVAKITTTVWLHHYWDRASYAIRTYLTAAVVALACLTSMGIFGLLSKAHLEQGVVGGEVQSKVALFDEKIKIQRENIETARKALAQMDAQVDQRLARGDSENSAERAVAIRRQQATERTRLLKEIGDAQKEISRLNEEKAPIASQMRKVEAEVGPIKYIAAMIYGDNPDGNTLEKAVRWVTILIVAVFDPLAIVLILAANHSLRWEREDRTKGPAPLVEDTPTVKPEEEPVDTSKLEESISDVVAEPDPPPQPQVEAEPLKIEEVPQEQIMEMVAAEQETVLGEPEPEVAEQQVDAPQGAEAESAKEYYQGKYAIKYISSGTPPTLTYAPDYYEQQTAEEQVDETEEPAEEPLEDKVVESSIETEGVTKEVTFNQDEAGYTLYNGKTISWSALKQLRPDLAVGAETPNQVLFGVKFPAVAKTGDVYTRTDVVPHRTYKFNGVKWIQVDRSQNTSYLQNIAYIQYLISKIDSGEYDAELLTEAEQEEITEYLKKST